MRTTLTVPVFLMACVALLVLAPAATAEDEKPTLENYDKFIGRELVKDHRAMNLEIYRPLPLACPPFHLRDKDGEIIDPTKDENGNPVDPMRPVPGRGIPRAVSTRQTCGLCHPYEKISHGYHFQAGADEMFPPTPAEEGLSPHQSPGYFGKWLPLYQRELAPKSFDDPAEIDLTPWEWIVECGICHPGGGPGEFDRGGHRYDEMLAWDRGISLLGDSDYFESAWDKTGVMEADCFMCHLEGYEFSLRAQHIKKLNYEYAATAAAGFGYVWGSVRNGQQPKVYYDESMFRSDGTVFLHIKRPSDRQCLTCHDLSSSHKRGSSWGTHYMEDVHTEQGVTCTKCHPGDIRHNFAKGSSSSQTVRDDIDDSMLSCKECHETETMGAPDYEHDWLPPLHLERISCEACHITHRPFAGTAVVDSITGKKTEIPVQIDADAYEGYSLGALWGTVSEQFEENLIHPYSKTQLAAAGNLTVSGALAEAFSDGEGKSRLPVSNTSVRETVSALGGMASTDARALMLMALNQTTPAGENVYPVCVFRGEGMKLDQGSAKVIDANLQPKRAGATIAETPFFYGRAKDDDMIHPEGYQLGVFWAYMDKDEPRPLFLKDMEAAWDSFHSDEFTFYNVAGNALSGADSPAMALPKPAAPEAAEETGEQPAEAAEAAKPAAPQPVDEAAIRQAIQAKWTAYGANDRKTLEIFDDNNDTYPEANTEEEIALMAWAIQSTCDRVKGKDLYYVKGTRVWQVKADVWTNPYETPLEETPLIGHNEPFMMVVRKEQVEKPAKYSWDAPVMEWETAEVRLAKAFNATVSEVELTAGKTPKLARLAQRLSWTVAHGVEPAEKALGAEGCCDCHSANSHFFFGKAPVDPYTTAATPATVPMYDLMGYENDALLLGVWRETVLKPWAPWIVLVVLGIILIHFALIGSKGGGEELGKLNALRFRFHERLGHLVAMVSVVILGVTGFCFLLGKSDPSGHTARIVHTYVGYVGAGGSAAIFLAWLFFMFPAKGDIKWLLKAGGYLGGVKGHLPAGKFNAGQKALFWIAMATMAALSVTGVLMALQRGAHFENQELFYTIHDVAALLMILVLMAHIYLATIVVPHSLRSLFGGRVSSVWAKAHHANWNFKEQD